MAKLLLARLSLLTVCAAAALSAAPISLGALFINDVGSGYADPSQDNLAFRLANFTAQPSSAFVTPITFRNVILNVTWENPAGAAANPLDWYTEANHLNPLDPKDLAPSNSTYESTLFKRGWGIVQATLRIDFDPGVWNLRAGGAMAAPEFVEFVFGPVSLPSDRSLSFVSGLPAWELMVSSSDPIVPEPSTYMLGGLGLLGLAAGHLRRQS